MEPKDLAKIAFTAGRHSIFKTFDSWWEHYSVKSTLSSSYQQNTKRYIYRGALIVFLVKKTRLYAYVVDEQGTKMKDLKQFIKTTIRDFLNENQNNESVELLKRKLLYHLAGGNIKDSVENIEIFINYFNGDIPNELKYEGTLYRIVQTNSKELYNKFLKQGFNSLPLQKYYACSKTLNGIDEVKQKTLKNRYKYYAVFKFDVTFDDVLFDINKLIDYVGLDENRFIGEEEVLVLSDEIPMISKNNIIDYGMY